MTEKLGQLNDTMKGEDTAQTNTPKYPEEIKVNLTGICDIEKEIKSPVEMKPIWIEYTQLKLSQSIYVLLDF